MLMWWKEGIGGTDGRRERERKGRNGGNRWSKIWRDERARSAETIRYGILERARRDIGEQTQRQAD